MTPLSELIEQALAIEWLRDRGLGAIRRRDFPEGTVVLSGPFHDNRAMRRARGGRGHGHGLGAMASSLRTRRA